MFRAFNISLVLLVLMTAPLLAADTLELLSGAKVQGEITARNDKSISMKVTISGVTLNRNYAVSSVHAITTADGTRTVLNEKGSAPATPEKTTPAPNTTARTGSGIKPPLATGGGTRAQLDKLIDEVGKTPPEWFEETKLNYPATLDLEWPMGAPPGGWNNQKNVGQFIWDVINPNQNRWKEGVKLLHHLLEMHKNDKEKTERHMLTLANMYHNLHEDYARSAFWFRQVGVERDPEGYSRSTPTLAECYWKLGFRAEALKLLTRSNRFNFGHIKVLADMGETDKAIQLAMGSAKDYPVEANFYAGDACRIAGRFPQALSHYQKLLDTPLPAENPGRVKSYRERATANIEAIKSFELFDLSKIADGSYKSQSRGYEGPVEVTVTVAGSKIADVKVSNHKEKQYYSSIADTPRKIIAKQSVRGIDTTSHATITSEAIVNAAAKALAGSAK